jgi:hypothetical protein
MVKYAWRIPELIGPFIVRHIHVRRGTFPIHMTNTGIVGPFKVRHIQINRALFHRLIRERRCAGFGVLMCESDVCE